MHIGVAILVLLGTSCTVTSEKHALRYIYTALSKDIDLPGIYEFTAMGTLDDIMIDYYDSERKVKVPKQDWMREKMTEDYWDKGTQSRKSKEQWFKVNLDILKERMRQNDTDLHILQWQHGCEIEDQPDGSQVFVRGFDSYSYDGGDFLAFDDDTRQWVAPNVFAQPTKRKWDKVEMLNRYTKGYLEKECVEWLNNFKTYCTESVKKRCSEKPPKVFAYAKKSYKEGHVKLTCWATDFIPKEITLEIRRNGVPVRRGVQSSGRSGRPNPDDTHQMWKRLEIPEEDRADYDCYVEHVTLTKPIIKTWDNKCADCSNEGGNGVVIGGAVVGGLVFLGLAAAGFGFYLYKKHNRPRQTAYSINIPSGPPPTAKTDPEDDTYQNVPLRENAEEKGNVDGDKDSGRGSKDTSRSSSSQHVDEDSESAGLMPDAV